MVSSEASEVESISSSATGDVYIDKVAKKPVRVKTMSEHTRNHVFLRSYDF